MEKMESKELPIIKLEVQEAMGLYNTLILTSDFLKVSGASNMYQQLMAHLDVLGNKIKQTQNG